MIEFIMIAGALIFCVLGTAVVVGGTFQLVRDHIFRPWLAKEIRQQQEEREIAEYEVRRREK
jgi:hypothetical protein